MLPVRPRSSAAAASSARTAGGDPSNPTTRYRFPVEGMTVFIVTPVSRYLSLPAVGAADWATCTCFMPLPVMSQYPCEGSGSGPMRLLERTAFLETLSHYATDARQGNGRLVLI